MSDIRSKKFTVEVVLTKEQVEMIYRITDDYFGRIYDVKSIPSHGTVTVKLKTKKELKSRKNKDAGKGRTN